MSISIKSAQAYWKNFGECGYLEPGEIFFVVAKINGSEKHFYAPEEETEKSFMDRIDRSIKYGLNLFATEWQELKDGYEGVIY